MSTPWTEPPEIVTALQRRWDRGEILAMALGGPTIFPLRLPLRGPGPAEMLARFPEVQRWIRDLEAHDRAHRGAGYTLEWREHRHRQLGQDRIPCAALVPSLDDALWLLGRQADAARVVEVAHATAAAAPEIHPWLMSRPLRALERAEEWTRLLAVVQWFQRHPRPGVYLRQLDIPGVDTKFIEDRRAILSELLDVVLPEAHIDPTATGAAAFERRYGLRARSPLVRLRLLDPSQALGGLRDLSIPAEDFARLDPPARRVFITENEVNGLCFPDLPESLVLFGLGYAVDRLADAGWLRAREVWYWGDLDTHGFAILSRLRGMFPEARSLLMDRETFLQHRALWGREDRPQRGTLDHLTADERALYEDLRDHAYGDRLRLEQERIGFGWVCAALEAALRTHR